MISRQAIIFVSVLAILGAHGQAEMPGGSPGSRPSPSGSGSEMNSSGGGSSVSIRRMPTTPAKPRTTTYIAVTPLREWKNSEGTTIRASLLAFDVRKPDQPKVPLTLIRNGKVRLLVDGKKQFSEFPLAKLSVEDQVYIKKLVAATKQAAKQAAEVPAEVPAEPATPAKPN